MKLIFRITTTLAIALLSVFLYQLREPIVSSLIELSDKYAPDALRDVVKTAAQASQPQQSAPENPAVASPDSPVESEDPFSTSPLIVLKSDEMAVSRAIAKVVLAVEQAEGAGARVRRSIGTPSIRNLSPFLMLDHFSIKPGAGFPDHPHRGQETITYLLSGGVDHEDFAGNRGTLDAGDLQFMTAGRGIVHAEMPRQNPDGSANVGLQLWVDLPAHLKSCEPRYRDLRAAEIPVAEVKSTDGSDTPAATIKVISGQSHGVDSVRDLAYTPVWILDITLQPGASVEQPLPQGWNAFAYILEGNVTFGKAGEGNRRTVEQYHNVVFESAGDVVHLEADADATKPSRLVLVAGTPLDQPVVQYGPFVLSSKEDVYKALFDYQTHSNGFERAKDWASEIGKSMVH
jgi:redox-sensitive bicupin YhaK (pirin superfamily)